MRVGLSLLILSLLSPEEDGGGGGGGPSRSSLPILSLILLVFPAESVSFDKDPGGGGGGIDRLDVEFAVVLLPAVSLLLLLVIDSPSSG